MKDEICPHCGNDLRNRAEGECCNHCLANEDEMFSEEDCENYGKGKECLNPWRYDCHTTKCLLFKPYKTKKRGVR